MNFDGFKVINFTKGLPSVSITNNGLTFTKTAILKLEKPEHVKLLLNASEKMMAIQVCEKEDEDATQFLRGGSRVLSVRWNNKEFLQTISQLMDWNLSSQRYRVDGLYLEEEKALVFDLKKAKEI